MKSLHSRVPWLCAALLLATLAGCSADRLARVPPKEAPQLAGRWTLDAAHSESIGTAVATLEAEIHKRLRRVRRAAQRAEQAQQSAHRRRVKPADSDGDRDEHTRRAGGPHEPQVPSVSVNARLPGAEFVRELVANVPAGTYLGIRFSPDQVTMRSAQGPQECTLGLPIAVTFGQWNATQTCGWRKKAFLIEFKPTLGPTLTERFTLAPDGELVMTLHLAGEGIDVRLVRRYRRTPRATPPVLLPTSD